jgi:hypothetical protein
MSQPFPQTGSQRPVPGVTETRFPEARLYSFKNNQRRSQGTSEIKANDLEAKTAEWAKAHPLQKEKGEVAPD